MLDSETDRARPGSPAVLFDIDGTLVDSNFLHVEAWARAFADLELPVPSWRIQRLIGADSSKLLEELIGDEPEEVAERAKDLHSEHYRDLLPRLRPFTGARDLIAELSAAKVSVVLATSAPKEELDELLGVLDLGDDVNAVTSAEDVETAKPEPDVIGEAVRAGGASPDRTLMIGDSVWDVIAAGRAGVAAIGVLSGGTGADDLLRAGAVAVYDDVAELREHLGDDVFTRVLDARGDAVDR